MSAPAVEIRINRACNERCLFCNSQGRVDGEVRTPGQVREALERGRAAGALEVTLSGREPTLDPRLEEYVGWARQAGYQRVGLQTNGLRLADGARAGALVAAGLDVVTVSLHALDPDLGRRLTGQARDVELTLAALDHLVRLPVDLEVNCVATRLNLGEPTRLAEALAARCLGDHDLAARRRFFQGLAAQEARFQAVVERHCARTLTAEDLRPVPFPGGTPHFKLILSTVAPTFGSPASRAALVPRLSEVAPHLLAALTRSEELLLPATLASRCGLPRCLLGSATRFSPVYEPANRVPVPPSHGKPRSCRECRYTRWCEGLWRGYVALYGTGEVVPRAPSH